MRQADGTDPNSVDWDGTDWEAGDCPPQLREALDLLRELGRGPVPEPSDAVAAFFVDRPVRRAPRRRRPRHFLAGVLVAASMGLGAGAVAAASGGFHLSVQAGADGAVDFSRPGISSAATVPGTASPAGTAAPAPAAAVPAQTRAPAPAAEQQPAEQRRHRAAPERTEAAAKRAAVPARTEAAAKRAAAVPGRTKAAAKPAEPERTKAPAKRAIAVPGPKQARTPAPEAAKRAAEVAGRGLKDGVRKTLAQLRGELRGL